MAKVVVHTRSLPERAVPIQGAKPPVYSPDHSLHEKCLKITAGHQWLISFMTRAELLMWPRVNGWGSRRREELIHHIDLCTTLLPNDDTCVCWADIVADSQTAGHG
jgi:hypothetical protein